MMPYDAKRSEDCYAACSRYGVRPSWLRLLESTGDDTWSPYDALNVPHVSFNVFLRQIFRQAVSVRKGANQFLLVFFYIQITHCHDILNLLIGILLILIIYHFMDESGRSITVDIRRWDMREHLQVFALFGECQYSFCTEVVDV